MIGGSGFRVHDLGVQDLGFQVEDYSFDQLFAGLLHVDDALVCRGIFVASASISI